VERNSRFTGDRSRGGVAVTGACAGVVRLAGGIAVAALAVVMAAVPAQASATAMAGATFSKAAAGGSEQGNQAVIDMVVLVDESGSETTQKVADEKATVGTIVQSLLNPASRVTVIGFGGANGVAPNQVPTDVACVPTIASGAANLAYLSKCLSALHRRTEQQGDDTDYAAALGQAMSYLSPTSTATPPSPAKAIKVILMMTDGAVDVHRDTQQYGTNWQLGEQTAINQQLAAAKSDDVQLWPLGFGTNIGNIDGTNITESYALHYLNTMAGQAAPSACGTGASVVQPHATWVNNPDDAISSLDQLYADASCGGDNVQQTPLGGGITSATLTVSIPEIASAAAISVARGVPGVSVTFQPPSGPSISNSPDISGQDGAVEVLHLDNVTAADVGTWRIQLTAAPGMASELVRATAFWQGAIRALTTVNPTSAKLGQQVKVTLDVLGPNGPITNASTLSSMTVGVMAAGNGLPGAIPITVAPVSGAPGEWAGTYTVPRQPTTLTFTGTASGYGLYTTEVSATVGVGSQTQGFNATPRFTGGTSVQAGGTIAGQVVLTNTTGSARRVKLVPSVSGAPSVTVSLTSPSGAFQVPSGSPPSQAFMITVGKNSQTGAALVQVAAVDVETGQVLNTAQQEFTITKPPGFLEKYKWILFGIAAAIIVALLGWLVAWKRSRDRRDVRHLLAILRRGGAPAGRDLQAGGKWAEVFPFTIHDEASDSPWLDHPQLGTTAGIYQVKRAGRGLVELRTPTGRKPYEIEVGGPGLRMNNGLELSFRDTRHPEWVSAKGLVSESDGFNGPGGPDRASSPDDWNGSGSFGGVADWSGSGASMSTTSQPLPQKPEPDDSQGTTPAGPVPASPPPSSSSQPQDPWV
jgi:von Willebrand factor type A domain